MVSLNATAAAGVTGAVVRGFELFIEFPFRCCAAFSLIVFSSSSSSSFIFFCLLSAFFLFFFFFFFFFLFCLKNVCSQVHWEKFAWFRLQDGLATMATTRPHTSLCLASLGEFHAAVNSTAVLNGANLTVPKLHAISLKLTSSVSVEPSCIRLTKENSEYLQDKIDGGKVIYGVNTGFGGSADVRSDDPKEMQRALIRHQIAGFSSTFPPEITRGVMAARVNSLCRGMSGVRPQVVELLASMLNHDIIPEVPMRGSVSASGDLMPTSYIAHAMMGGKDAAVVKNGRKMLAPEALSLSGLEPVTFEAKEALAVINSCSFSATLASSVLYEANKAALFTQVSIFPRLPSCWKSLLFFNGSRQQKVSTLEEVPYSRHC